MKLGILGDRNVASETHRAIDATFPLLPPGIEATWVATDSGFDAASFDAIWLAPGSPYANDRAVFSAISTALDRDIPFLGTCGGFQYACLELARRSGVEAPAHAEREPDAAAAVIEPLSCALYGRWTPVHPVQGTRLATLCGEQVFDGFHMCGYGLVESYVAQLIASGVVVSARNAEGVEAIELPSKRFFVATSFQPQMENPRRGRLHPLIAELIRAGGLAQTDVARELFTPRYA